MKEFFKKLFKESEDYPNWLEEYEPTVYMKDFNPWDLTKLGAVYMWDNIFKISITNPRAVNRHIFIRYYQPEKSRPTRMYEIHTGKTTDDIHHNSFVCELETLQQLNSFYIAMEGKPLIKKS